MKDRDSPAGEVDKMRKYDARIYYNATIKFEVIEAKNLQEANDKAFKIAYALTGYGEKGFLENVIVKARKTK